MSSQKYIFFVSVWLPWGCGCGTDYKFYLHRRRASGIRVYGPYNEIVYKLGGAGPNCLCKGHQPEMVCVNWVYSYCRQLSGGILVGQCVRGVRKESGILFGKCLAQRPGNVMTSS